MSITLSNDQRYLLVGATGTGKSTLAREILTAYSERGYRIVIIDGPDHGWIREQDEKKTSGTVPRPSIVTQFNAALPVQMYQPTLSISAKRDIKLQRFMRDILKDKYIVVYFDDIIGIANANSYPDSFAQLYQLGRKRHIVVMLSTQRSQRIPEPILSQTEHFIVFRIRGVADRKRLAESMGVHPNDLQCKNHDFFYLSPDLDKPVLYER